MSVRPLLAAAALALVAIGAWSPATARVARTEAPTRPTYTQHVRPILQKNCVACHRAGETAPFSLEGYDAAKKWAKMAARVTTSRQMPPWLAADENKFHDERRLTEIEIATLRNWEQQGAPEGSAAFEAAVMPLPPRSSAGWTLGKPDAVLSLAKPYKVAASGPETYRYFVLRNPYEEVKWLRAMHPRPGNPGVVHHMSVFADASGDAARWEQGHADGQPGYTAMGGGHFRASNVLGLWTPGTEARSLPAGHAIPLRPNESIVVLVHYAPTGKAETDDWKIGLYFTDAPQKQIRMAFVESRDFNIPAGAKQHRVRANLDVGKDATILAVMPHMHALGKAFQSRVFSREGDRQDLIDIPAWNPAWQSVYWYREPVKVAQGSRIEIEATFDNSAENLRNPSDPPKRVRVGEASDDEMCHMVVIFTFD